MTNREIQEGFKILKLDNSFSKQPVSETKSMQQPYCSKEPYQKVTMYKYCHTTRTSNIKNS